MPKFIIHVSETRHFEFEVEAADKDTAFEKGRDEWIDAPTTGQWELAQTETDYAVTPRRSEIMVGFDAAIDAIKLA